MKNIPIWKIIVFSIITLGVYDFVWYIRRQREIESTYDLKIPHWLWMVIPNALLLLVVIPTFIFLSVMGDGAVSFIVGSLVFVFLISPLATAALGLTLWWLIVFSRAAAKITAGRIPIGWSLALFLLVGRVAQIIAHQYYFNRYTTDKIPVKNVGASQKFRNVAILAIVVSIALGILLSAASMPAQPYVPEKIQPLQ